jgi:hypothetical protein
VVGADAAVDSLGVVGDAEVGLGLSVSGCGVLEVGASVGVGRGLSVGVSDRSGDRVRVGGERVGVTDALGLSVAPGLVPVALGGTSPERDGDAVGRATEPSPPHDARRIATTMSPAAPIETWRTARSKGRARVVTSRSSAASPTVSTRADATPNATGARYQGTPARSGGGGVGSSIMLTAIQDRVMASGFVVPRGRVRAWVERGSDG